MATPGNVNADDLLDDVAEGDDDLVESAELEGEETEEGEGEESGESAGKAPVVLPSQKNKGKEAKGVTPQPSQPPKRDVPLATFLEEKRKFTEALDEQRARADKLEKDLESLRNPPKPAPKHAEDPEGFIAHATRESAKSILEKLEEQGKALKEVASANNVKAEKDAEKAFLDELDRGGQVFAHSNPDYGNALHHVRQIAFRQMQLWYPDATPEQIVDAIGKQELAMAKQAIKAGRDPHEMAYKLALTNGYKKAAPTSDTKKGKVKVNGNKRASPVEDDDDGEETLDPSQTLGRSNGEAPDDDDDDVPDPDTVDSFDDAFNEVFKPRQKRRSAF